MESDEGHPTKLRFPQTMPPFSSDNPIQALYLKKKGVERLLARDAGNTMAFEFAKETRKQIEMESMLIDRRGDDARKDHCDDNGFLPRIVETIPSIDEIESRQEAADDDTCPDISCYDSDEDCSTASADWSLPGVEGRATDIRYIYGDQDYYDRERRQKQMILARKEKRERSKSSNTMELIAKHLICHSGDRFAIYDWIRCI